MIDPNHTAERAYYRFQGNKEFCFFHRKRGQVITDDKDVNSPIIKKCNRNNVDIRTIL